MIDGFKTSDLNAFGFPYGFVAARPSNVEADAASADDDDGENATAPITHFDPTFPVLFSNNMDSAGAKKLAAYLREGYFLDKLTSEVRVTILIFSPYIKSFTVLNGELWYTWGLLPRPPRHFLTFVACVFKTRFLI